MPSECESVGPTAIWNVACTIDETLTDISTLQDEQIFHPVMLARPNVLGCCRQYVEQADLGHGERGDLHYQLERVTGKNECV